MEKKLEYLLLDFFEEANKKGGDQIPDNDYKEMMARYIKNIKEIMK